MKNKTVLISTSKKTHINMNLRDELQSHAYIDRKLSFLPKNDMVHNLKKLKRLI